ncbi:ComF family protein [Amycolatopsis sulphurea]|nr:hypothetical protein [Amycolatopsis sulphurea]
MQRIAEEAARRLSNTLVAPALTLSGGRDSVGLTPDQRARNLYGRLHFIPARRPPPNTHVLLVDDVITTGTTSAACVTTLAAAGIPVAGVVALLSAG